jgi:hypothetical protein
VLTAGGREYVKPLRIVADPRVAVDAKGLAAAADLSRDVVAALARQSRALAELRKAREQFDAGKAKAAPEAITAFEKTMAPFGARDSDDTPNLEAIGNALIELQVDLEGSDRAPTGPQREAFGQLSARLDRAISLWQTVKLK